METSLDTLHELQLNGYHYDGNKLVAEVSELVVGSQQRLLPGSRRYSVTFHRPAAHAMTEQFPAALATWIRGSDEGFLRRIDNNELTVAMGLDTEPFQNLSAFALISAHEILVVFCAHAPEIQPRHA